MCEKLSFWLKGKATKVYIFDPFWGQFTPQKTKYIAKNQNF